MPQDGAAQRQQTQGESGILMHPGECSEEVALRGRQPRVSRGFGGKSSLWPLRAEPLLDLGKKLSVPQDLMMEELSLRNNRGSLLFQKRQRRVQRFTFEFAASPRVVS